MYDDLISRNNVLDALYNASENLSDNMWSVNTGVTLENIEKILSNLPSASKLRHWTSGEFGNAVCSECGYDSRIRIDLLDWNYRPKCGTRMENVIS